MKTRPNLFKIHQSEIMSFRSIPQYSQGYPQVPPQSVIGTNQSLKNKRNQIGRQPGNNIQQISFSNPYGEIGQQHGPTLQVTQPPQQTVQYYVQQPPQPPQPQPQFNRMPSSSSVYPQFVQSGYSYPIYQTKNIVNSPEPPIHQMQSHIQQQQPIQHMQISHNPQESMIYQSQYQKMPVDYLQMQQPKIQMRQQQQIESKPVMHHQSNQLFINYQQQQQQQQVIQQRQQQQSQHRMESSISPPASVFNPDFNSPPAGPFDIVGRGNLPSFDFVYSQDL